MPAIDEDTLRGLMHHSTRDLHAPPAAVTAHVISRYQRRRKLRIRALGAAATGVAAGTAFGLLAASSGGPGQAPARPAITLTAAQRTLNHFSAVAARTPQQQGRYVVFSERAGNPFEKAGGYLRTSVIDSRTGTVWTYQNGAGVPGELPADRHGSMTQAQYDAMPVTPAPLRAALLAQAARDQAAAQRAEKRALQRKDSLSPAQLKSILRKSIVHQTSDDQVFEEASLLLWNPLVSPALRSAVFKLLAGTPGVVVRQHARDSSGRPAVEISRHQSSGPVNVEIFENPAGTSVLETAGIWPDAREDTSDLYLSITRSATRPARPYHR
jgi:hypothetical protein